LKNPIDMDLSNCGLSVNGVNPIAKAISAGAALTSIALDGQPLSGSTPGKHPHSGRESFEEFGVDKADANISAFKLFCEALASSRIEIISMKNCYLGPQALNLLADAIKLMAAVTSVNCLHNPLGEGVHAIIKIFEETPRIRTLCGVEEGVEQIDWSN